MELALTSSLGNLLRAGSFLNDENVSKTYTLKEEVPSAFSARRPGPPPLNAMMRKRKNYYSKLLEMLVRKTESERRVEIFGSDPFK